MKKENYIRIAAWMLTELHLSGNELLCYALIHGFCLDGEGFFTGSIDFITKWLNCSRRTVSNILDSLVEKKLVKKEIIRGVGKKIAGCRYFTIVSRQCKSDYAGTSCTISESDGTKIASSNDEKNAPDEVQNFHNSSVKSSLPNVQKMHGTGAESAPNNIYMHEDTAAIYISPREAAGRVFGQNCFDENFDSAAAAFLPEHNIRDFEDFFRFVKAKADEKKPDNMRSYVHSLIFKADVCAEYASKRDAKLNAEKAQEAKMHTCPACGERFGSSFNYCQTCGLSIDDWSDEAAVARARKFHSLSDDRRRQYENKYNAFREKLVSEHGLTYFRLPEVVEAERVFMRELDAEFGVAP